MKVSATLVRQLRERTGAGIMDCKRALERAAGGLDQAAEELRLSGMAGADSKAGRQVTQGLVLASVTEQADAAVLLEINCETDFVARSDAFQKFAHDLCRCILRGRPATLENLLALPLAEAAATVEEERRLLVARLGENIVLRRFNLMQEVRGSVTSYLHGGGRIGVLVELEGGDEQSGRDLAMQIAWGRPRFLRPEEFPGPLRRRLSNAGNGAEEEVVKELVLSEQPFIKDQQLSVGEWLRERGAEVRRMERFEVGRAEESPLDGVPHDG